jgi:hypothetical protein
MSQEHKRISKRKYIEEKIYIGKPEIFWHGRLITQC